MKHNALCTRLRSKGVPHRNCIAVCIKPLVDDEVEKGQRSVEFLIRADGKTLYRSGIMISGDSARHIDVALTGGDICILEVNAADKGNAYDHADWDRPTSSQGEITAKSDEALLWKTAILSTCWTMQSMFMVPMCRSNAFQLGQEVVFDAPILFARSVDTLLFRGNTIERSNQFDPYHSNKSMFKFES